MKTPLVLSLIALTLLATFPARARANERPPGEMGLLLGLSRLDRDVVGPGRRADWSPVYGLRFGTSMDRKVDYFFEGLYGRFDTSIDRKSSILEMRAGLERNFPLGRSPSSWYLAGALGYADVNLPAGMPDAIGDFGRPLVSAGIGIKGPSNHLGHFHAEVREEWWPGNEGIHGADVNNTQVLVGWSFGLRGANAPARRASLFEKGKKSLVLNGVNFVTNSAELTPESKAILDHVAGSLKDWAEVNVEIEGHTDSVADPAYNMDLSQRRAESVLDYLVSRGVASSRLSAKGYGETHPVASNDTPGGRAKNRRVELRKTN
ncbi:MAG TPA: OmpA family protein [Candidatus Binatia bacterium]|nr:OmpA family protein [Candidatus Binatia bacterium]